MRETFYDVLRRQGVSRRSFLKFCSLTASALGMGPAMAPQMAHALETKPRTPVLWLHGLECTCCSEAFLRSAHPLAKDVILSMISLDYHDTIMAAAGHQAEAIIDEIIRDYKGEYILACEGNPPLNEDGMYCIIGGKPYLDQLKHAAEHCKAIISWGSCASWGCVQAARPNPTQATPIHKVVTDKPVIKVPGCPPIPEVMTVVITYMATFDRLPQLDRQGRPKMFYSQRIHDKCYRRPHFDAGQFVESWDDEGARKGYCLYKMGCKGPTTYNACSTVRWNGGLSFPIQSGHGCMGCSEDGFWDNGSFYDRLTNVHQFGVEANADEIGLAAAGVVGAAVAVHAGASAIKRASAGDTLIVQRAPGTSDIRLAPQQYVRVAGQLRPRPVVYISLDLISMSRIDTNDRSFDAEFYLSFRSDASDIDISDIHFTNAYRAQTGKGKLISWRQIHGGQESSSFPSNVKLYRVSGKFNFEPELGRYPFDTQRLSISFQPASASQPFLIQPPSAQSITTPFLIDGWNAKDRYVGSDQDIIPTIDRHLGEKRLVPFYKFNSTWVVSRNATDYYLRVIVPLGFILLVTYFSIFLGHARFDSTVAIQVTALLSAIALYLALPKVDSDQATLSDKVFMITYAMVSFMIGLSVLKDWSYVGQKPFVRRLVSFIQTIVYPVIAIGLMTSLVAGPVYLAEMSEKLTDYIGTLISWA